MEGKENKTRDMMKSHYGDEKANKSVELNSSMTITDSPRDKYTSTIMNIGGSKSDE